MEAYGEDEIRCIMLAVVEHDGLFVDDKAQMIEAYCCATRAETLEEMNAHMTVLHENLRLCEEVVPDIADSIQYREIDGTDVQFATRLLNELVMEKYVKHACTKMDERTLIIELCRHMCSHRSEEGVRKGARARLVGLLHKIDQRRTVPAATDDPKRVFSF